MNGRSLRAGLMLASTLAPVVHALGGCTASGSHAAAQPMRLLGEACEIIPGGVGGEEFLDRAERYAQRVQEEQGVPRPLRVKPVRVSPRLLRADFDLAADMAFRDPIGHAIVGGFPVRLEIAVEGESEPAAHWRLYYTGGGSIGDGGQSPLSPSVVRTLTRQIAGVPMFTPPGAAPPGRAGGCTY